MRSTPFPPTPVRSLPVWPLLFKALTGELPFIRKTILPQTFMKLEVGIFFLIANTSCGKPIKE
jgi:hypothetical protein